MGFDLKSFCEFSTALTAFDEFDLLATGVAPDFLQRFNAGVGPATVDTLAGIWRDIVATCPPPARAQALADRVFAVAPLALAARRLILLWYTGGWYDTEPYGDFVVSSESYIEGLMWKAIGAHPMAAKPQGFGAWALPPHA